MWRLTNAYDSEKKGEFRIVKELKLSNGLKKGAEKKRSN